jgi:DNA-binding Lrp family transcriptional regulator
MSRDPEFSVDDTDRDIIRGLHQDPRATNKTIAGEVGVSEATAAIRIRRLVAEGVLRFTVQRNALQQGIRFHAIAYLTVSGRSAADVANDLARIDDIFTVIVMEGDADLIAFINARSHHHVQGLVHTRIGKIRGIRDMRLDVTLEVVKDDNAFAMIGPQPL